MIEGMGIAEELHWLAFGIRKYHMLGVKIDGKLHPVVAV